MPRLQSVQIFCAHPHECAERFKGVKREFERELPPILIGPEETPNFFTEVSCIPADRRHIEVHVVGLHKIGSMGVESRRQSLDFIDRTLRTSFTDIKVEVLDDDELLTSSSFFHPHYPKALELSMELPVAR